MILNIIRLKEMKNLIVVVIVLSIFNIFCSKNLKEDNYKENTSKNNVSEKTVLKDSNYIKLNDTVQKITETENTIKKDSTLKDNYINFNKNVKSCIDLLNKATTQMEITEELLEEIKSFKKPIDLSPKKIIDSIKYISKIYIDYQLSLLLDATAMRKSMLTSDKTNFSMSNRTNQLISVLLKTPVKSDVEKFRDNYLKLTELMEKSNIDTFSRNRKKYHELLKKQVSDTEEIYVKSKNIFRKTFKLIFGI